MKASAKIKPVALKTIPKKPLKAPIQAKAAPRALKVLLAKQKVQQLHAEVSETEQTVTDAVNAIPGDLHKPDWDMSHVDMVDDPYMSAASDTMASAASVHRIRVVFTSSGSVG